MEASSGRSDDFDSCNEGQDDDEEDANNVINCTIVDVGCNTFGDNNVAAVEHIG